MCARDLLDDEEAEAKPAGLARAGAAAERSNSPARSASGMGAPPFSTDSSTPVAVPATRTTMRPSGGA